MGLGIDLVEHGAGGADRHPAAVAHGVARVEDEIDEHLLELPAVGPDLPDLLGQAELQDVVLAQ